MTRRSAERRLALVLGALLLLGACSGGGARRLPPPSSTSSTEPEPTTTTIDYSLVPLETVPGTTTSTLLATGDVVFTGTVQGPDGLVVDARVRVERLVDDGVLALEVRTGEDGTWTAEGLPGGRYRVRAFLPPVLTSSEPVVFYAEGASTRDISLTIQPWDGMTIAWATTPKEPIVGDAVSLGISVVERFVDDEGFGRTRALPNTPVRVQSSGWRPLGEERGRTADDGMVVFGYACDTVTSVNATVIVGAEQAAFPLPVPPCAPMPTTTTTSTTEPG